MARTPDFVILAIEDNRIHTLGGIFPWTQGPLLTPADPLLVSFICSAFGCREIEVSVFLEDMRSLGDSDPVVRDAVPSWFRQASTCGDVDFGCECCEAQRVFLDSWLCDLVYGAEVGFSIGVEEELFRLSVSISYYLLFPAG
jgi:hypothetical protein